LRSVENNTTSDDQQRNLIPIDLGNKPTMNTCFEYKKGRPFVPHFLLTFEVFKRKLHNCLVYLGASSNFMPLFICKKLNIVPLKSDKHVIQLDKPQVKVMGELKDVMIIIAMHPKFFQVIDIIIVDIPEAYGLFLSRDWSEKLNGYFSTDWAHLWLPLKGKKNMIRIDRERYLKHMVTAKETLKEPSSTNLFVLGSYSYDSYFRNFPPLPYDAPLTQNYEMVFEEKFLISTEETLFCQDAMLEMTRQKTGEKEINEKEETTSFCSQIWTIYFDGSKSQEGSGEGCILIDRKGKNHFLSCRLEFE
jgi:hypothetical protein